MGFDHLAFRFARRALSWLGGADLASPPRQALAWLAVVFAASVALASGIAGLALELAVAALELTAALIAEGGLALVVLVNAVWAIRRLSAARHRPASPPVESARPDEPDPPYEQPVGVRAEPQAVLVAPEQPPPAVAVAPPASDSSEAAPAAEAHREGEHEATGPDEPCAADADPEADGSVPSAGRSRSQLRRARRQLEAERRRGRADADASLAALMGELVEAQVEPHRRPAADAPRRGGARARARPALRAARGRAPALGADRRGDGDRLGARPRGRGGRADARRRRGAVRGAPSAAGRPWPAALAARLHDEVRRGYGLERVSVRPIKRRVLERMSAGEAVTEMCERGGFRMATAAAATSWFLRRSGLLVEVCSRTGKRRYARTIAYELAVRYAVALEADPYELGV